MLGWIFPRSPLAPVEKAWTETSMLRLAEHFGPSRLLTAQVALPPQHVFPDAYDGSVESAGAILTRMCEPLALPPEQFSLEVMGSQCRSGPPENRSPNVIRIGDDLLPNPYSVAATVAHELAWRQLPLQQLAGLTYGHMTWLADLTAVYMGLGVVLAHVLAGDVSREHSCSCGPGQPGTALPARMMGYALALFAHIRGEARPTWKNSLRLDALSVCNRSMRYLHRTGDTLFTLDSAGRQRESRSTDDLLYQLKTGSRSARVAALWELRDACHAEASTDRVVQCLYDRLPAIREEAAKTLAEFGPASHCAIPALIDLLQDSNYAIRAAAARALGKLGANSEEALSQLAPLLRDPDRHVVHAAAVAIENHGARGAEALPFLLGALRGAMIRCDHELIDALTHTLYAIDTDPTDRIMEYFEDDAELREQAVHVIVDALNEDSKLA